MIGVMRRAKVDLERVYGLAKEFLNRRRRTLKRGARVHVGSPVARFGSAGVQPYS